MWIFLFPHVGFWTIITPLWSGFIVSALSFLPPSFFRATQGSFQNTSKIVSVFYIYSLSSSPSFRDKLETPRQVWMALHIWVPVVWQHLSRHHAYSPSLQPKNAHLYLAGRQYWVTCNNQLWNILAHLYVSALLSQQFQLLLCTHGELLVILQDPIQESPP